VQVPNPLYGYTFPKVAGSDGTLQSVPVAASPKIERCTKSAFPAQADANLRDAGIENQVTTNIFIASSLSSYEEWTEELENVHNTIHTLCTCGGQMAFVPLSAFDPIL